MKQPTTDEFPMRINRYLAKRGYATRTAADELIAAGKVWINGRKAVLGDKVGVKDTVDVRTSTKPKTYRYFAYNKPVGVVTHSPGKGERDIRAALPNVPELRDTFPIGRLDKDSHGLIILTNDGRITDRLLNPEGEHEKEYLVRTREPLRESFKKHMEAGVTIEDYVTKPAKVALHGERSFSITLTEGKKHQVRRMVVAMHNDVADLKRTRIMNVRLGKLATGSYCAIEGAELETFLAALGLT